MDLSGYQTWFSTFALFGLLFSLVLLWLIAQKFFVGKPVSQKRALTPDLEKPASRPRSSFKAPERSPGIWTPVEFKRPAAAPYPGWDIETTKPLPYRPFRYGPYHITMGLRTMQWDDWIELDSEFPRFHADKTRRIAERESKCCITAPEAYDGAVELLEELADYLPQRYPTLYSRTADSITNMWNNQTISLTQPLASDPITLCSLLVQDDLAIMFEKPDGQYYLLSGAILLAGFWRLTDKFGMPLSEIHTSGDVPGFKPKLEKGMMNFFRRIQPAQPVLRNNYFIQVDDDLAWSSSIGSEDGSNSTQSHGWATAQKNKAIEHHYLRSERQSLRRLPRSGGVVFTIRTYFHPITEIVREKGVPGRLASAVRSWGEDVSRYKGRERYGDVLLEYLDREHRAQVERGEVKADEDEREMEAGRYPF
ncbi:MAG: hypothetical protein HETSPECPRED_004905 [Heterodermia speciosa]|uniref:Alpha-1,2-mannosyltransferase n=1 Tax=Heterodermia speciosa TaxID=116794 RepID=A0A8H3I9E0_9LECA|nr:MAG: hypothetical protein HETSPECPRED_004905 [Heterodermia speciosa]